MPTLTSPPAMRPITARRCRRGAELLLAQPPGLPHQPQPAPRLPQPASASARFARPAHVRRHPTEGKSSQTTHDNALHDTNTSMRVAFGPIIASSGGPGRTVAPGPARGRDRPSGWRWRLAAAAREPAGGRRSHWRRHRPAPAGRGVPGSVVVQSSWYRRVEHGRSTSCSAAGPQWTRPARPSAAPMRRRARTPGCDCKSGPAGRQRVAAGVRADADRTITLGKQDAEEQMLGWPRHPTVGVVAPCRWTRRFSSGTRPPPGLQHDPGHRADRPGAAPSARRHGVPARLGHPAAVPGGLLLRRLPVPVLSRPDTLAGGFATNEPFITGASAAIAYAWVDDTGYPNYRTTRGPARRPDGWRVPAPAGADHPARAGAVHGRARPMLGRIVSLDSRYASELPLPLPRPSTGCA